jgi:hypothetical protein
MLTPRVAPQKSHLPAPHLPTPHMPHLQAPHLRKPHVPRVAHETKSFFSEFGTWAHGLSTGAKLRVLTLGLLGVWFIVIAGPWTTVTAVSSAVGGLQLFNGPDTTSATNQASIVGSPFGNSRNKVANAVPTQTPVPTRTPQPTFTPLPKPTLVQATRIRVPTTVVVAAASASTPTPAVPALAPPQVDPRLVPGSGKDLPLVNGFKIIPATVGHGQKFWRVFKVEWQDISESNNNHDVYVRILDENGKRVDGKKLVVTSNTTGEVYPDQPNEKTADDMCNCNYNYPMYGDGYNVQIIDSFPSDKATGMIMPMRRHVNYFVYFQLVTNP